MSEGKKYPELHELDPTTRAWALVGRFLQSWALMEVTMDQAIGKCMDLPVDRLRILSANVPLAQKVNILSCAAMLQPDTQPRKEFLNALKRIMATSDHRNIVAHTYFTESKDGKGVRFGRFTAKRELKSTDVEWSQEEFDRKNEQLEACRQTIDAYIAHLNYQEQFATQLSALAFRRNADPLYSFSADTPLPLKMAVEEAAKNENEKDP